MTQTEFLSIFGSLTGLSALIIHLLNYWEGKPNIEISFPNPEMNVFFRSALNEDGYNCPSRCAVYARIENRSNKPITIIEFRINLYEYQDISNMNTIANESYELGRWDYPDQGIVGHTCYIGKQQMVPPLTIEPYGCRQGFIFFVTNKDSLSEPIKVPLEVITTRKEFCVKATISPPKPLSLANSRDNKFIQKSTKESESKL